MIKTFIAAAAFVASSAQAQLTGTSIDASYAWPDVDTIRSGISFDPSTFIVGDGVESTVSGDLFAATVEFTDAGLSLIFVTQGVTFVNFEPFHGFVFDGDGFLGFDTATLLASTTIADPDFDGSDVMVVGDRLLLNVSAVSVDSFQRIDIAFGNTTNAIPEPASWALMIAGFGLAGSAVRRRKISYAIT